MESLYDILGAPQDASDEDLRRAYHRAARRLHPDVNLDVDTNDDMRHLNRAWAVLGDPHTRRSYDLELTGPPQREPPARIVYLDEPTTHPLARLLRPSALILAVLLVIFVVTAYAGPQSNDRSALAPALTTTNLAAPAGVSPDTGPATSVPASAASETTAASETSAASDTTASPTAPTAVPDAVATRGLLGECLKSLPGYDAVVQCNSANDGMVVAEVKSFADCPRGTRPYQLAGRGQIVCLQQVLP